jgi:hypothetical protein
MKTQIIAAALVLPLALSSAFAQEAQGPTVKISGYGTGALTWTNTDQAEFGRTNQVAGAKKNSPRTGVDSNLGLQADVGVNSWLSFTGQGLVRRDAEDNYGAELTWAFAKAKINDELSVRVGRIGVPAFMISDYRNVGYIHTFLRPPVEMYAQVLFNSLDGIDATYQRSFGDTTVTSQVGYGVSEAKVANASNPGVPMTGKGDDLYFVNLAAEHGPFTARVGHLAGKVTVTGSTTMAGLLTTLRGLSATPGLSQLAVMADELEATKKPASFTSVGFGMDWNNIVAQTEFAIRKQKSYVVDTQSWYVMGGYRFGKVLPYVIHGKVSIEGFPENRIPAGVASLAPLRAGVARIPYNGVGQGEQSTTSIGVRWDFYRSMAFKAQIDRVKPTTGSGLLVNAAPGFNKDVTVGAVAIDFVF